MANLYITEYSSAAVIKGEKIEIPDEDSIETTQKVAFTTATQSAAFGGATEYVRIVADADFHAAYGSNPTATANSPLYKSGVEYFRKVTGGLRYSFYDGTS